MAGAVRVGAAGHVFRFFVSVVVLAVVGLGASSVHCLLRERRICYIPLENRTIVVRPPSRRDFHGLAKLCSYLHMTGLV